MTTFSREVKNAVCAVKSSGDEKAAELFGMLYSADRFDEHGILFVSECEEAVRRLCKLLTVFCKIDAASFVRVGEKGKRFIFECDEKTSLEVSKTVPFLENSELSAFSNSAVGAAFVRGLFLAAGSVSDPKKTIYAEIGIKNDGIIEPTLDIFAVLGICVRVSHRKTGNFFYFKTVDDVSQLLFEIGAKSFAFDCINSNIVRTIRNDANRAGNCDVANAKKQATSSLRQSEAAKLLKKKKFEGVSEGISATAEVRLNHPDMNIEQLAQLFDPPLSKSGMAYRLKKLVEAAEKLK